MTTPINNNIRIAGATNPTPDYTLISAWEDDIPADLITADEQWVAECYADWSTGLDDPIVIVSRTTDSTRNIIIKAAAGEEHNGIKDSGFILTTTAFTGKVIVVNCENVSINDIEIKSSTLGTDARAIEINPSNVDIDRCIASRVGSLLGTLIKTNGAGSNRNIKDCLLIGSKHSVESWTELNLYNNVMVDAVTGFNDLSAGFAKIVKNNIAFNNSADDFVFLSGSAHEYNASEDTTATGANSITGITSAEFVDAANNDYHLLPISQLIGAGLNLIENPPNLPSPQYDIDGDQWPDTGPWDIGYDHYISAGVIGKIYLGAAEITAMKLGGGDVIRAYLGNEQVFGSPV